MKSFLLLTLIVFSPLILNAKLHRALKLPQALTFEFPTLNYSNQATLDEFEFKEAVKHIYQARTLLRQ